MAKVLTASSSAANPPVNMDGIYSIRKGSTSLNPHPCIYLKAVDGNEVVWGYTSDAARDTDFTMLKDIDRPTSGGGGGTATTLIGVDSARPSSLPSTDHVLYWATDVRSLYLWDGTAWNILINGDPAEYGDNTDAVSNGLVVGEVYRTGDFLKIVHS